ncbi:MAG: M20/M25/M40 family metallo-hydrolase [Acidobacteriaceae bacterium]|nr:M20/M25/M40 family metallo-hydrolase [Acidobacteriaceae bacterium]
MVTSAAANRRITALASQRSVHAAFGWLHLHEQQLRRWQRELIAIPAPTFQEGQRAAWFLERFREFGLENVHIDEAGNALATLGSPTDGPMLLLSAHMDTVFSAETDLTVREEEDGTIFAPGATDNAAGLTALLALAAALQHSQITLPIPVLFAANTGEEGRGDLYGMRHLFQHSGFRERLVTALALEGAGTATVIDRALGSRRLRLVVTGPGGHSWADAGRPNPILALSAALLVLDRISLPSNPRTTLNVGVIRGGNSVNSIPEEASAELDLRSASSFELDRLELTVLKIMETKLREFPGIGFRAERIGDRPAGHLPPDAPLSESLRAVDRHLQISADSRIGSTDANLPLSLGIPALAIGCGGFGGGIHTLSEWYTPADRTLALRRILLLLLDTCNLLATKS